MRHIRVMVVLLAGVLIGAAAYAAEKPASASDEAGTVAGQQIERLSRYPAWQQAIEEARYWQLAGDMALLNEQPQIAYPFYQRLANTFPGTLHGRVAAHRGNVALREMKADASRIPPGEDIKKEIYDILTW